MRIPALARLVPRALLLDLDAYRKMRERPHPAVEGLDLLLVLGAALGLASTVAAVLHWATSPDPAQVQQALGRALRGLPLWRRFDPDGRQLAYLMARPAWWWSLTAWLWPSPLVAVLRLPATLLNVLLGWLGYGLVAHPVARILGGRGRLEETLGCTALAEVPQALLLLPMLPPFSLVGVGILAWVLAGRFLALKAAHQFAGWRAFWAALLPALILAGATGLLWAGAVLILWLAGQAWP